MHCLLGMIAYWAISQVRISISNCIDSRFRIPVTDDNSLSQGQPEAEPLGGAGRVVGGLLFAVCFLVATAVLFSWASSLVIGTALAFWPAIVLALGILVVFIVTSSR